jgi:hypothetical protein
LADFHIIDLLSIVYTETQKMKDYQKGKIYRLQDKNNSENFYIGSTIKKLQTRLSNHIELSKTSKERKVYKYIFANGGWKEFDIVLVEDFPCTSSYELRRREAYYFELLKPPLNTNHPRLTPEQKKEKMIEFARKKREESEIIHCDYCMKKVKMISWKQHIGTKQHKKVLADMKFYGYKIKYDENGIIPETDEQVEESKE